MSEYKIMKKLIATLNRNYENGRVDDGEYAVESETYKKRLGVFYAKNRLSDAEYEELMDDFKTF